MNQMDLMRVPGLGLAAAMPNDLMSERRVDRRFVDDASRRSVRLPRVFDVFRARHDPLAASPSGTDLARV